MPLCSSGFHAVGWIPPGCSGIPVGGGGSRVGGGGGDEHRPNPIRDGEDGEEGDNAEGGGWGPGGSGGAGGGGSGGGEGKRRKRVCRKDRLRMVECGEDEMEWGGGGRDGG